MLHHETKRRGAAGRSIAPIRVAAIGASRPFATSVRRWFIPDPSFDFVGWCTRGTLDRLIETQKPDVLLVDGKIDRPLDFCARARRESTPRIVVLAEEASDLWEFKDLWKMAALEAGARGVLGHRAVSRDLAGAVRAVHDGQLWGPPTVVASMVRRRLRSSPRTLRQRSPWPGAPPVTDN